MQRQAPPPLRTFPQPDGPMMAFMCPGKNSPETPCMRITQPHGTHARRLHSHALQQLAPLLGLDQAARRGTRNATLSTGR